MIFQILYRGEGDMKLKYWCYYGKGVRLMVTLQTNEWPSSCVVNKQSIKLQVWIKNNNNKIKKIFLEELLYSSWDENNLLMKVVINRTGFSQCIVRGREGKWQPTVNNEYKVNVSSHFTNADYNDSLQIIFLHMCTVV